MKKYSNLFCTKPFTWLEVGSFPHKGDCYLCCPGWVNMPIGNLYTQSVKEVWNSENAQKIRGAILDGSFKYCNDKLCPALINRTDTVVEIKNIRHKIWRYIMQEQVTKLPFGPKRIHSAFDRSCNIYCPSCRKEPEVEIDEKPVILAINQRIKEELLPDAYSLRFSGTGDPFGSPYQREWLRSLREKDVKNLSKILLHTNGMLWTRKNWEAIDKDVRSKITSAEISIDAATYETYAINRCGGDFNKLLKNLEFISNLRKEGRVRYVKISMVVQANNYKEMKAFVKLGRKFDFSSVYFSQLTNWGTYSDEDYKKRAVCSPDHPKYEQFREILHDDIFKSEDVYMGNLADNTSNKEAIL